MNTPPSANFYDILLGKKEKKISLVDGGVLNLRKLPFAFYFEYESYRNLFNTTDDPIKKLESFFSIMGLYNLDVELLREDVLNIFFEIVILNHTESTFAWQLPSPEVDKKREKFVYPIDYPGRDVAHAVAILGSIFSWSSNHILYELTYDEVNAYIQEALLIRHTNEKLAYNLSDVGYKTSSDGKTSEKIPYPDLYWMTPTAIVSKNPKMVSKDVYDKYMPNGVIVDLTDHETAKNYLSKSEKENES